MSINSNIQTYMLQILEKTREPVYNQSVEVWKDVNAIEVSINTTYKDKVSDDGTLYSVRKIKGVTRYDAFIKNQKYRIVLNDTCYEIEDCIPSRLIRLELKEVSKKVVV